MCYSNTSLCCVKYRLHAYSHQNIYTTCSYFVHNNVQAHIIPTIGIARIVTTGVHSIFSQKFMTTFLIVVLNIYMYTGYLHPLNQSKISLKIRFLVLPDGAHTNDPPKLSPPNFPVLALRVHVHPMHPLAMPMIPTPICLCQEKWQ